MFKSVYAETFGCPILVIAGFCSKAKQVANFAVLFAVFRDASLLNVLLAFS
jgi:hypothetical protein